MSIVNPTTKLAHVPFLKCSKSGSCAPPMKKKKTIDHMTVENPRKERLPKMNKCLSRCPLHQRLIGEKIPFDIITPCAEYHLT